MNVFEKNIEKYFELKVNVSRKLENEEKPIDFRNLLHLFTFLKSNENFKKDKIKYPIILYFYIMIDGLGDFNWLDVYLLLLIKFGYNKKDIHIVINFEMKLYSMIFQYTEDIKTLEFNNEIKQFLEDFFAISQADEGVTDFKDEEVNQTFLKSKFLHNQFNYESTINKLHNIYAIIINNKTNLYDELKTRELFGILYYIYIINKYYKYILNLIIDIETEYDSDNNIEIFINNYPLFKNEDIFPLIISFSLIHYQYLYNKYKYISMSEGGCSNIQQICSGVNKNFIGLYDPFIDLMEKDQILDILNIKLINDKIKLHYPLSYELSYTNIIYSYAYLSKNMMTVRAPFYVFKLVSYICLLYCFDLNTKKTKIRYLFISENFNLRSENIHFFKERLEQDFNLTITEFENIYIIKRKENDNIIIISFFKFLEKNQYLNMIYHSNMPNYTTGDLTAQESLMLGKFIIHDYMSHKQKFYNLILNFCIENCNIDHSKKKLYAKELYSFMNQLENNKKFKHPLFTYEKINEISKIIIQLCKIYEEIILVKLKEQFNFNNNFLILLVFIFCIKDNINLIDEKATNIDFSILIDNYRLNMLKSRNKYIKYKTKYLKKKLNI